MANSEFKAGDCSAHANGCAPAPSGRTEGVWLGKTFAVAMLALAGSCATTPPSGVAVPFEVTQGELVELWGVSAVRSGKGVDVSGSVTRPRGPNRPFNEHLHAEAISPSNVVLEARDVPWNSITSLRVRHSATFTATFMSPDSETIARIRLKVVPGAVHFSD